MWGLREGVLPGVFLLSRCLRSGWPVLLAIRLGPGLIPIILDFQSLAGVLKIFTLAVQYLCQSYVACHAVKFKCRVT